MRKRALDKLDLSEERKTHYKNLGVFLKANPEIEYKKLSPVGFAINISTIPANKTEEFIRISTFKLNN